MSAQANKFANCKTFPDLEFAYEMAMSPENISCDGELSRAEVAARAKRFEEDFKAREFELSLASADLRW